MNCADHSICLDQNGTPSMDAAFDTPAVAAKALVVVLASVAAGISAEYIGCLSLLREYAGARAAIDAWVSRLRALDERELAELRGHVRAVLAVLPPVS